MSRNSSESKISPHSRHSTNSVSSCRETTRTLGCLHAVAIDLWPDAVIKPRSPNPLSRSNRVRPTPTADSSKPGRSCRIPWVERESRVWNRGFGGCVRCSLGQIVAFFGKNANGFLIKTGDEKQGPGNRQWGVGAGERGDEGTRIRDQGPGNRE